MQISDAVAFVTGANRGIGRAIIDVLLEAGSPRIYATARDPAALTDLSRIDTRVHPVQLDITDPAGIDRAVRQATDVTLLVNNAGVLDFGNFLDVSDAQVERNFAANFSGPLNLTRALVPAITANGGGTIVNMLTLVALASMPGLSVYNASKAAAWSMTQSLRATLAPRHIKVMSVFPGAVDTDMIRAIEMPKTPPADVARAIVSGIAAGTEDVFPDAMSASLYEQWKQDHKAIERQFGAM